MTHPRLSVSHSASLSGACVSPQFQVLSSLYAVISQSVFFTFFCCSFYFQPIASVSRVSK